MFFFVLAGAEISDVQQRVENHLHDMILKTFDPKKADAIFAEEGETPSWLAELIEYPTWRSLIYRLAEDYPDCLMLNFTIKLISDAGFQVYNFFTIFISIYLEYGCLNTLENLADLKIESQRHFLLKRELNVISFRNKYQLVHFYQMNILNYQ